MKLLISFFFLSTTLVYSQKRDNIWLLSSEGSTTFPLSGIDFSSGVADPFVSFRSMSFFITNANMCDTAGNIIFYSNGKYIANKQHDTLLNSSGFNKGYGTDTLYSLALGFCQGLLFLPRPDHAELYSIFSTTVANTIINGDDDLAPLHLSYSEVDMTLDNGLGGVTVKDKHLIEDTLVIGRLTACKHGNGRDWWIFSHEYLSNRYYSWLLMPDTILGPFSQAIGSNITEDFAGQSCFSPDGNKYATVSPIQNTVNILNFDRCSGLFNNVIVDENFTDLSYLRGCAFSPNSRFLYVNNALELFQYDLTAPDVVSSRIKVADWDTFFDPFATLFFMEQLAPDGKIYLSTFNGTKYLHVINQPDFLGADCNVIQHGLILPHYNTSIPNHPSYNLGALVGSSCDTIQMSCDIHEPNDEFPISTPLIAGISKQGAISMANDKDIYSIKVKESKPNIKIVLSNLPENYDIILFDSSESPVVSSKNKHKKKEEIIINQCTAGVYYIGVYQQHEKFDPAHCYTLSFKAKADPFKIVEESYMSGSITLFPNPTMNYITIGGVDQEEMPIEMIVYDLAGSIILSQNINGASPVDVSSLVSGSYLMKLQFKNHIVVKQFYITK